MQYLMIDVGVNEYEILSVSHPRELMDYMANEQVRNWLVAITISELINEVSLEFNIEEPIDSYKFEKWALRKIG